MNHPTIASFVRPSRPTDPRRSFVAALTTKYVEDTTRAAPATDAVATAAIAAAANTTRPIRISGKVVEEVGFDKVRQRLAHLSSLQIVLLEDLAIGQAKPARCDELVAGIAHTCPSIVELSLASNLLEEWAEVVAICGQLPALQVLRVGLVPYDSLTPLRHIIYLFSCCTTLLPADIFTVYRIKPFRHLEINVSTDKVTAQTGSETCCRGISMMFSSVLARNLVVSSR